MSNVRLALSILSMTLFASLTVGALVQPTVAHAKAVSYEVHANGKTLVCVEVSKGLTVCSEK